MHLVKIADAPAYAPPQHFGVDAFKLQSPELSGVSFCSVGLSYYSPGGHAAMDAGPQQKVYVVLSGEITVLLASGERKVLGKFDSCLIEANERREVRNDSQTEAIMLVLMPVAGSAAAATIK